jgi:hypothetical protein
MSYDLFPTILTLKWLRKEHSRSLRMALFAETSRSHRKRKIKKCIIACILLVNPYVADNARYKNQNCPAVLKYFKMHKVPDIIL